MSEPRVPDAAPGAWRDALRALPDAMPPADGWTRLSATLDARARPKRRFASLAIAASLLLALAAPILLWQRDADRSSPPTIAVEHAAPVDRLSQLQAESAWYEAVLARLRDERVASGNTLLLADALDAQIADVDAALSQPALAEAQRVALWQARVASLRDATELHAGQRWLAAHGTRSDARPVVVN